jgi:hypothetical protein
MATLAGDVATLLNNIEVGLDHSPPVSISPE